MIDSGSFTRVLVVARSHAAWVVVSVISMVLVSAATVFAYNLVRPLCDQLLDPSDSVSASAPGDQAHHGLIGRLDRMSSHAQLWLQQRVGHGRRAILLLVLLAIVVKNGFSFLARYSAARFGLATMRDLRVMLFDALLGQSPAYFHCQSTGVVVSRVVHDVEMVREALAERFGDLLQDSLTVVALLVYVVALNPRMALVTLVITPLMVAPMLYLSRRLRHRARQSQERMGELAAVVDETVRGMPVVQIFAMEERLAARFRTEASEHFIARLRARAVQAANAPVMEIMGTAAAVGLIGWAAGEISAGTLSVGDFSAFLVAVYGAYNPVKRLNKFNLAVQQAAVAADRIFAVVDAPRTIEDAVDAEELRTIGDGIRFDRVSFAYSDGEWVLEDLDLEIRIGSSVALVGASGVGKTTVAQLIARFWDPQRGAVRIGGSDLRRLRLAGLRSQIALVSQDTVLFNDTVRHNITAGRSQSESDRVEQAARAALAHDFINELPHGYDTVIGEAGARLSGGQRQRLAIARALYKNPAILILDEATSALDPESERLVGQALGNLMRQRTTLLIAHRLSTVRLAERIAVLADGRIVEQGDHDTLMAANGLYRRMVEAGEAILP